VDASGIGHALDPADTGKSRKQGTKYTQATSGIKPVKMTKCFAGSKLTNERMKTGETLGKPPVNKSQFGK
jgi:hypothetical protein